MTEEKAPRLAAAAPIEDDDNRPDPPVEGVAGAENFDDLIEQWERWKKTRRYYAPAPASGNLLGKLRGSTQPSRLPPDAPCRPNMAALHLAIIGQPREALDVRIFWLYYVERATNIKRVAESLGISRGHFYRLRDICVRRVLISAKQIEADNLAAGEAMPHKQQSGGAD